MSENSSSFPVSTHCKWHAPVTNGKYIQSKIDFKDDMLAFNFTIPQRRSQAPHAVRRIANEVQFSRPDEPHLTSFLRFPSEIRLEIYRYLVKSYDSIKRDLCPETLRMIEFRRVRSWKPNLERLQLEIFPAILETCRTVHQEGSMVLYGENRFVMRNFSSHYFQQVAQWHIGPYNAGCIATLSIQLQPESCNRADVTTAWQSLYLLPGLKNLTIHMDKIAPIDWAFLIQQFSPKLQSLGLLTLHFYYSGRVWESTQQEERKFGEEFMESYVEQLMKFREGWEPKDLSWNLVETDDEGFPYPIFNSLKVIIA